MKTALVFFLFFYIFFSLAFFMFWISLCFGRLYLVFFYALVWFFFLYFLFWLSFCVNILFVLEFCSFHTSWYSLSSLCSSTDLENKLNCYVNMYFINKESLSLHKHIYLIPQFV